MMDPSWQMCHCARHVRTGMRDWNDRRTKEWMLMSIAHMSGLMTAMSSRATSRHVAC